MLLLTEGALAAGIAAGDRQAPSERHGFGRQGRLYRRGQREGGEGGRGEVPGLVCLILFFPGRPASPLPLCPSNTRVYTCGRIMGREIRT